MGNGNGITTENRGENREKKIVSIPIVLPALLDDANESFIGTMHSLLGDKKRIDVMISAKAILRCANMKKKLVDRLIVGTFNAQTASNLLP